MEKDFEHKLSGDVDTEEHHRYEIFIESEPVLID